MTDSPGPPLDWLRVCHTQMMGLVTFTPRKNDFVKNMAVLDGKGNGIGEAVMLLLRGIIRLLMCQHPTYVTTMETLKKGIMTQLHSLGLPAKFKNWFLAFFDYKPDNRTVLNNLMRTYHSASETSITKLSKALQNPAVKGFGLYVSTDPSNQSSVNARTVFGVAKDHFFDALGIDVKEFLAGKPIAASRSNDTGLFDSLFRGIEGLANDL